MAEPTERLPALPQPGEPEPELSAERHEALERRADHRAHGAMLSARPAGPRPSQPRPNRTGLPDGLKSGVEALSGVSLDGVKVHYNSSKPAQLGAHAFAQGREIHLAPGQDRHLPHEAWHLVQQAQGRVRPTMQLKEGIPVNDDSGLEHEADVMGARSARFGGAAGTAAAQRKAADSQAVEVAGSSVVQRVITVTGYDVGSPDKSPDEWQQELDPDSLAEPDSPRARALSATLRHLDGKVFKNEQEFLRTVAQSVADLERRFKEEAIEQPAAAEADLAPLHLHAPGKYEEKGLLTSKASSSSSKMSSSSSSTMSSSSSSKMASSSSSKMASSASSDKTGTYAEIEKAPPKKKSGTYAKMPKGYAADGPASAASSPATSVKPMSAAVLEHREAKLKKYLGSMEHMAGETKDKKTVVGGHLIKAMRETWGNDLKLVGTPVNGATWEGSWTIGKRDLKDSTFFPADWDTERLKKEIEESNQVGNELHLSDNVVMVKRGATFYPRL